MKRLLSLVLVGILLFSSAQGAYWQQDTPILCTEDRQGCRILQMVMRGDFDGMDLRDNLNSRMLSAALPWLKKVTQEDMRHLLSSFPQVDEETLQANYHRALANCLLSDIRVSSESFTESQRQARSLLLLFMDPAGQADGLKNRAWIRSQMTDELVQRLVEETELPLSFIEYLVYTDQYEKGIPSS